MSKPTWKKKLPAQYLFWLEAVGLEIVLSQPTDIYTFAAEYFENQLQIRKADLTQVPTYGYFHKIFSKRLRNSRISVTMEAGAIGLKHSSHAYNLHELCRRDSEMAHITFPDDELEYKHSVEIARKKISEEMDDFTRPEIYIPNPLVGDSVHCALEDEARTGLPSERASTSKRTSDRISISSRKTLNTDHQGDSLTVRSNVGPDGISVKSVTVAQSDGRSVKSTTVVESDRRSLKSTTVLESDRRSIVSGRDDNMSASSRPPDGMSMTSRKDDMSVVSDGIDLNDLNDEISFKSTRNYVGNTKIDQYHAEYSKGPYREKCIAEKDYSSGDESSIKTNKSVKSAKDYTKKEKNLKISDHKKENTAATSTNAQKFKYTKKTSTTEKSTEEHSDSHKKLVGLSVKYIRKEIYEIENDVPEENDKAKNVTKFRDDVSVKSEFTNNLWPIDADNSTDVHWFFLVDKNAEKIYQENKGNTTKEEQPAITKSDALSLKEKQLEDIEAPTFKLAGEEPTDDVAQGWFEYHYEDKKCDKNWDHISNISNIEPQRSNMDTCPKAATQSTHCCNQFCTSENMCPQCGEARAKIMLEGSSQTKTVNVSNVGTGGSREQLDRDILPPKDGLLIEANTTYECDTVSLRKAADGDNIPQDKKFQDKPQSFSIPPNYTQSTFSDSPSPGVNVTGTISVATSKKSKEHDGPITVEVLTEADDDTNDIIDVEINLHCTCLASQMPTVQETRCA